MILSLSRQLICMFLSPAGDPMPESYPSMSPVSRHASDMEVPVLVPCDHRVAAAGGSSVKLQLGVVYGEQDKMPRRGILAAPPLGSTGSYGILRSKLAAGLRASSPFANCTSSIPFAEKSTKKSARPLVCGSPGTGLVRSLETSSSRRVMNLSVG